MNEWDDVLRQIRILEETGGQSDPLTEANRLSVADYWKRKFDQSKKQWEEDISLRDREKAKLKEGYREEERTIFELGARLREIENRIEWERLVWEEKFKVKTIESDFEIKKKEAEARIKALEQENERLTSRLKVVSESLEDDLRKRRNLESEKARLEEAARSLEAKIRDAGSEDRIKVQFLERERDSFQRRIDDLQAQLLQARFMPTSMMPMEVPQGGSGFAETENIKKLVEEHAKEVETFFAHEKDQLETTEDMTRGFAHKVRNYLGVISGTLQLCISNFKMEEELKNDIILVDENAQEMLKTIEDYLALTKVPEMTLEKVPAADFLNLALGASEDAAKAAGVSIAKEIPSSLPAVSIDSAMMKDAVKQIVDNAVEASSSGQKIKVFAKQDADKGMVVITFSDQGKGVGENQVKKVFQPYFTSKKGRKGFGLSTAKRAVHLHHGFIKFESVKTQGSVVTLSLPAAKK